MENGKAHYAQFEPPELPPIVAVEPLLNGWRGLTQDGMILNVEAAPGNGSIEIPFGGRVSVNRNGEHIGYREIPQQSSPGLIDRYTCCLDIAVNAMQGNHPHNALAAIETAMSIVPTLTTHYNRGMILLELGRWQEGFAEYAEAIEYPGSAFARPQYARCIDFGLKRWRGEDIIGKRLLLIHDHGFGDSIMVLRYVSMLKAAGAHVTLWVPPELERLARQCAPVVNAPVDADYFCSLLFLLQTLGQSPTSIPLRPYLSVDPDLVDDWRRVIKANGRRTIGVAWSPGVTHERDYPRAIPLEQLVRAMPDDRLISVQQNAVEEAEALGVEHYRFEDFADAAVLMSCCDEIITIDTAAVHLAGAIGHKNITLLLSHWHSWRWRSLLYQNLKICTQDTPGDWDSALEKMHHL